MGVRFEINLEPVDENTVINREMYKDSIMRSLYYHMKGYPYYKLIHDSKFKVFTFSHLIGKNIRKIDDTHLSVKGDVKLIVSTIDDCLAKHLIKKMSGGAFLISSRQFKVLGFKVLPDPDFDSLSAREYVSIKSVEPVNVVRGVVVDGRLKEYDVKPSDSYYTVLLRKSVVNKMKFMGFDLSSADFNFQVRNVLVPLSCSKYTNKNVKRCGSVVELRLYRNNTSPSLFKRVLEVIYYTGLGHNNSKGFGMVNIY